MPIFPVTIIVFESVPCLSLILSPELPSKLYNATKFWFKISKIVVVVVVVSGIVVVVVVVVIVICLGGLTTIWKNCQSVSSEKTKFTFSSFS